MDTIAALTNTVGSKTESEWVSIIIFSGTSFSGDKWWICSNYWI